ncbi:hypothetical protein SLNHY_2856 [Streptomyces albus]|nr:hypothetical protein SLNHY_2856 [Streptomyces albus]
MRRAGAGGAGAGRTGMSAASGRTGPSRGGREVRRCAVVCGGA